MAQILGKDFFFFTSSFIQILIRFFFSRILYKYLWITGRYSIDIFGEDFWFKTVTEVNEYFITTFVIESCGKIILKM